MYQSTYLFNEYKVTTTPGDALLIFPWGEVIKGGKVRNITPEFGAQFKLPHWKPAIKLGSHEDETPAGGHILKLEARNDGLYAIPEYNETGTSVLEHGAYRYYSPEIIWPGDGCVEHPITGEKTEGPLLVGMAFLHNPHLGEAAALYKTKIHEGETMSDATVAVPKSLWDTFAGWVKKNAEQPAPEPVTPIDPEPKPEPDAFKALQTERDDLAAKIASMEAVTERKILLDKFTAELKGTALADKEGVVAEEAPEMLAGMTDEQSAWALQTISALSERINKSALFGEAGKPSPPTAGDPSTLFNAAIEDCMVANRDLAYDEAFAKVADEKPEMYGAFMNSRGAKNG